MLIPISMFCVQIYDLNGDEVISKEEFIVVSVLKDKVLCVKTGKALGHNTYLHKLVKLYEEMNKLKVCLLMFCFVFVYFSYYLCCHVN